MRTVFLFCIAAFIFCSCNNNGQSAKTFCDTTCNNDSLKFTGDQKFKQTLVITKKDCKPDSVSRSFEGSDIVMKAPFSNYVSGDIHLNKSATAVAFEDTVSAWLSFNDCITGRGYLLEFPFQKGKTGIARNDALNSFDKKFSVDPDLRAYTDRGNIFVVNVTNGKTEMMTFKDNYADMDFNDIHKTLDSINVTKNRIYVKLLKNGKEVPLEKNINL